MTFKDIQLAMQTMHMTIQNVDNFVLSFCFPQFGLADTGWRDRTDDLILNPRSPARDAGLFIQIFRCGVKKKDLRLYFVNSVTKGLYVRLH